VSLSFDKIDFQNEILKLYKLDGEMKKELKKKAYKTPSLKDYGDVKSTTRGSGTMGNDGALGMTMN